MPKFPVGTKVTLIGIAAEDYGALIGTVVDFDEDSLDFFPYEVALNPESPDTFHDFFDEEDLALAQ